MAPKKKKQEKGDGEEEDEVGDGEEDKDAFPPLRKRVRFVKEEEEEQATRSKRQASLRATSAMQTIVDTAFL